MDFYSLKRKKLQALCKKHGIPANKTNLEMAKLLTLTLQETGELISENDGNAVNEKKNVRFSPHDEIREYEPSGYRMEGRTSRRRTTLAKSDIMANDNLSNKVLGKKRGRLNEKVGRTTRSRAELDKESSSCMVESEPLEEGDEVQASLQTGEDIVKDSMPAAGLRRSRRKSVVTVVGKAQQLKEEVEDNVANLNTKVQWRSSRRNSAATTNKMNETAARIGQQKRKCEAEAIQGIETSKVVDKSLVGQPTRRSTRQTSKRVNNRQNGTSKMAIVVEETTFTNASTQCEDAGLSKNDTCTDTSTQNEDGGLSMQDAKSLEKKGRSCSGRRSVASIDVCTLQPDVGKEMDSPGNSEDIAVLAPINLESASTGEAFKIAGQSLLLFSGEAEEHDAEKPSEQPPKENLRLEDVIELPENVTNDEPIGKKVDEYQYGECEHPKESPCLSMSYGANFDLAKESQMQAKETTLLQNIQDSIGHQLEENNDYEENAHIIAESKGVKVELMGDDGPKTVETRMDQLSRITQEDRPDDTIEDEEIVMGENETAEIACEDLIDPSNCSRIGESAIDHQEVVKEQLEVHQDTGEDYLMDDNACLTPNKLLLSVDDSKKANNLEDLDAVPSKNEAMVDRKSASASSDSPYNENGTSECKVEKPSKHALQVDLVSKAVTELIVSAFDTERIAVEVAEHQHGECESQMENLNFAISNEVIFEQAKELEQNESPKVTENAFGTVRIAQEVVEHQHSECETQTENLHFAVSNELEQNESPKVVGNAVQATALFEQTWNCDPSNSKEDRSANLIVDNEEAVESINNVPKTGEIGQENEALELNMFFGEDEEIEVEKPSEQPLEFNLTSEYARESTEKVKITEPDGEQVAEYQYGQCEHQTEGQFLTISDDAAFDQANEPQAQANRPVVFDDIQDSIAHEIQENKSVETEANVNIAVENEGKEMKLTDVVPKKCEMTMEQFSEFGQEVKDQVMEDVEIIIGENGGAQIAREDTNDPADNSNPENSVRDHQEVSKEQSNMQQGISENLAYAEQKELCAATPDKLDREAVAAGDIVSSVLTNDTLRNMVGSKQSSSSNWEVSKPAEILLFADAYFGKPEFASVSFLKLENSQTCNDFEVQEREESAFRENDRTPIACKDLEDTANGLSIGSTTRNHQDAAKEKEALEQNLLLGEGEGEEYEIEKSSEHPSKVSLTREGADRVLQENVLITEPASKQEHQVEGPCLSVSDEAKFEEVKEQQSVLLCCGADKGDGTNCKSTLRKVIGSDEGITTLNSSAIKENAMSMKKSKVGDLTAPKTLMKRRPLEDVTEKA